MRGLRDKLSYANVVSTLCLFLLLGGGVAFAATQLPANSVGTRQLRPDAVTGAKVKDGSLTGADINSLTLGPVLNASFAGGASLAKTATHADNSDALQGRPASAFLAAGATAANSDELGGLGASSFLGGPVLVRTNTEPGPTTGSGISFLSANCHFGEAAVGGGFLETGEHANSPGLGFGATYQLRGSGPADFGEDFPVQVTDGQTPTVWLVVYSWTGNAENPAVTAYVDCVPNR